MIFKIINDITDTTDTIDTTCITKSLGIDNIYYHKDDCTYDCTECCNDCTDDCTDDCTECCDDISIKYNLFNEKQNSVKALFEYNNQKIKSLNDEIFIYSQQLINKIKPKNSTTTFIYHNKYNINQFFPQDKQLKKLNNKLRKYIDKKNELIKTYEDNEKIYFRYNVYKM